MYDKVCAPGSFNGDRGSIVILTFSVLAGIAVLLPTEIVVVQGMWLAMPPAHPEFAWIVNVPGVVEFAVPEMGLAGTAQAAVPEVSSVYGVPPFAAVTPELTVTVCAIPGT